MHLQGIISAAVLSTLSSAASFALAVEDRADYLTQIKPLLQQRCSACHGALKQEAGLRLDTVANMNIGGDSGAAIVAGDASASLIFERVSATDPDERMPPEHLGEPLSLEQISLLRNWIAFGAAAPADEQEEVDPKEHWAFQPIVRPVVPVIKNTAWVRNPIDAFIAEQHQKLGLTPQAVAPREILVRRLYLDLLGIPPTEFELSTIDQDHSEGWYERTVEHLLSDPRHGERWARHWMDIWRYSDWWGLGDQLRNSQKHIWHWRDWIIESLNGDLPYDEMLRLMLAADELYPDDLNKLRATGFLARNYFLFNRPQWMEETVEHVSKGILGLTMNCAKCHDHKYDPLEQLDFYRMRAFFEPYHVRLEMLPGEPDLARDGIPRVFDGMLDTPTYRYIRGQETNPDKTVVVEPGVPAIFAIEELKIEPVQLPATAWQPARRAWVIEAFLNEANIKLRQARNACTAAREKLSLAERSVSREHEPAGDTPAVSVDLAHAELRVAEAAEVIAKAEQHRIVACAEAMRAAWKTQDHSGPLEPALANVESELAAVAVRAERRVGLAKSQQAVAVAELELLRATVDQQPAAEATLAAAREALLKASENAEADVAPSDQFTQLAGAQWTPTRFLNSGQDDPAVEFNAHSTGRRTALAKWITDRRHPLTARVAVNHLWTRHMGQSLVSTVFDFGRNGARPTHPQLIDWLAAELIEHDWSMKHLHRLIVTSATYRMSSSPVDRECNTAEDPDNQFWWRRVPIRLESQVVRDSILSLAGRLESSLGGPPVLPEQQATSHRRSLYFFHSNNDRNLFLAAFDEALVKECYRREQSVVPQQALALTNSQLVLDAAEQIASELARADEDENSFIQLAFRELLGIQPGAAEIEASQLALESWRNLPQGTDAQARANFVWALLNHNDFVTLR